MTKFQPYILFATLLIFGFVVNEVFISCKPLQVIIANASPTDFNKKTDSFTFDSGSNGPIELRSILSGCNKLDNYFYDPNQPYLSHDKKIKVNVHFVNSLDSTQNFNGAEGIDYAKGMLHYANGKLRDNKKMNLPEGNDTPIHPLSYRYELTPNPDIPGDNGIYFHYLEEPFFLNYGKNKNNYDRKIINDLAVNLESVLNIFYMVHPPDSVSSKTYKAKEAGIALGNAVKLGVNFNKPTDKWSYAGLLNHEIGHVLGLSHALRWCYLK